MGLSFCSVSAADEYIVDVLRHFRYKATVNNNRLSSNDSFHSMQI